MVELLTQLAEVLNARSLSMATAESCTGGLIGGALTSVPGSSAWFKGGVVAYADEIKTRLLWVPEPLIREHGAVSRAVAAAMADGACSVIGTPVSVAVTGISGPGGGTAEKPVGTVWFAWRGPRLAATKMVCFPGDREEIRTATVRHAVAGLIERLEP